MIGLLMILIALVVPLLVYRYSKNWLTANFNSIDPVYGCSFWFGCESLMSCWLPLMLGGLPSMLVFTAINTLLGGMCKLASEGEAVVKKSLEPKIGVMITLASCVVWFVIMRSISPPGTEIQVMFDLNPDPPKAFLEHYNGDIDGVLVGYALGKYMFLFLGLPAFTIWTSVRGYEAARALQKIS